MKTLKLLSLRDEMVVGAVRSKLFLLNQQHFVFERFILEQNTSEFRWDERTNYVYDAQVDSIYGFCNGASN